MRSPAPTPTPASLALFSMAILAVAHADEPGVGTEFERVLNSFGQINTIAGRGDADDCNGWHPSMEGGLATSAELSRPHMAQADAAGNVYIADKEGYTIRMVKPDGTIHTVAGTGVRGDGGEGVATDTPLREPNGLFTFPDGTTYILETNDDCTNPGIPAPGGKIRRLGTDGMMTTIIDDPELLAGRGLWVSPDESLIYYSSFDRVKKWTPDGGLVTFASGFTQAPENLGLGNLDIDPVSGLVCVTDRSNHLVYRLSADGTSRTVIAGNGNTGGAVEGGLATATALDQVRGIAFRPDGSFFVCTHKGEHAVWFIDTAGRIWKLVDGDNNCHLGDGTPISSRPQNAISEPRAVTIAPNGDLLITENDDGYIRRVTNICIDPVTTKFDGATGALTWTSHREASYVIQKSNDLQAWSMFLNVTGSNGPTTSAGVTQSSPRDYFRVVEN